jgi:hypothetical protein
MVFTEKTLISPNVYTSPSSFDSVALVSGSSPLLYAPKLLGFVAENTDSGTAWVQLFDGYAAPQAGAVPILSLRAATNVQVVFNPDAFNCISSPALNTGIVIALSSTVPTYTAISTHYLFLTAFWLQ